MGYDSTISVYDESGKYMGDIVDDISFRAILNLIRFSKDKQLSKREERELCIFGDIRCSVKVIKEFLYDCEKNGMMNEIEYHWDIFYCKEILKNKRIHYFSITSV